MRKPKESRMPNFKTSGVEAQSQLFLATEWIKGKSIEESIGD